MYENKLQDDPYGTPAQRGPDVSSLGFIVNLLFIAAVIAVGVLKWEQDWAWYKNQLVIYHSVQDGVAPEDMPKQYMAAQLNDQMKYKGVSQETFFFDKWGPLIPGYVLALLVPFVLGLIRLRRPPGQRMRWWYVVFFSLFCLYGGFFVAYYFGYLGPWIAPAI